MCMKLKWYQKLERKYRKYAIPDLMKYIVIINAVVFVLNMLVPLSNLYDKFSLDPTRILSGEVWRLVTFLFLPPTSHPLWIVFTLYFYYLVGSNLEQQWGSFHFNLYYLIGVLSTIAAAFIGFGTVSTEHLNKDEESFTFFSLRSFVPEFWGSNFLYPAPEGKIPGMVKLGLYCIVSNIQSDTNEACSTGFCCKLLYFLWTGADFHFEASLVNIQKSKTIQGCL